jgi:hypothetical protein
VCSSDLDDVIFIDERTDEYMKLVEDQLSQNKAKPTISIALNEEDEINVDDI